MICLTANTKVEAEISNQLIDNWKKCGIIGDCFSRLSGGICNFLYCAIRQSQEKLMISDGKHYLNLGLSMILTSRIFCV